MCYFLHGAINEGVKASDYNNIMKNSQYHFTVGTAENVNKSVKKQDALYRLTSSHCDCDTPIGKKDTEDVELEDFAKTLRKLKTVRGIKYILLSKNWWNQNNEKQKTVHIDDINLLRFLANIEDNCLYKIELYPKYY